jgi:hypothetical protein
MRPARVLYAALMLMWSTGSLAAAPRAAARAHAMREENQATPYERMAGA